LSKSENVFRRKKMMKKIFLSIICLFLLAAPVSGQINFLVAETTTNTTSAVHSTSGTLKESGICVATASGTAATNFNFLIEGSLDNTTFYTIEDVTYTIATPASKVSSFYDAEQFLFWRVKYVTRTGGTTDSALTVKCRAGDK
jgi:hypothetical protein